MKPKLRSILVTFVSSAICTGAGIVVGVWIDAPEPLTEIKCSDAGCIKRIAESTCGGPETYQLVNTEVAGERKLFTFVCVGAETV